MMDDAAFWKLIDEARDGGGSDWSSAQPSRMKEILSRLTTEEVLDFGHTFYEKVCDLNDWSLWGAGHVIAKGMGDDQFHYFRSWIVGRGRQVFDVARQDPDSLGAYVGDPDEVDNELLEYAALDVLQQRGSDEDPRDRSLRSADGDPAGEMCPKAQLRKRYPKLAKLFG